MTPTTHNESKRNITSFILHPIAESLFLILLDGIRLSGNIIIAEKIFSKMIFFVKIYLIPIYFSNFKFCRSFAAKSVFAISTSKFSNVKRRNSNGIGFGDTVFYFK